MKPEILLRAIRGNGQRVARVSDTFCLPVSVSSVETIETYKDLGWSVDLIRSEECQQCLGKGECDYIIGAYRDGSPKEKAGECDQCHGSGVVEVEVLQ